jgi:hypothetical protein
MEQLGPVEYPGFAANVWKIHFQATPSPLRRVLISAGIHGDEPASTEMAVRFVEKLSQSPGNYKNMAIDIVPMVNPWGWVHDTRCNQIGIDINRDFSRFGSREANLVKKFLETRSYDLMVDLHEDSDARGFYLYQYGLDDKSICEKIITAVREMGYPIEQEVNMMILRTENGIIDAPLWGLWYMRLTRQLSITNYYRLNNSQLVFTVETPTRLAWNERLIMQNTAVTMLLEQYSENR